MAKSLVIVESPAKAKTINKYLGRDYVVKASMGHIRDLPRKKLGVDVDEEFAPTYEVIPGKEKVIRELKAAAEKVETIYVATDPDREGEAIGFHIAETLSGKKKSTKKNGAPRIQRVLFNEITKKAILEAFQHAGEIDQHLVDAQQARRVLDRLVGYQVSPLLWDKVRRGISAGRVQTVAVRLIVEREREIKAFAPQEYWTIDANLSAHVPPLFDARLTKFGGQKLEISNQEQADIALAALQQSDFLVEEVTTKEKKRYPVPSFITSKLQQEASRKLRFTVKKTMMLAQRLYEGVDLGEEGTVGLITYMRTDSTRVSAEALAECRELIASTFGPSYLPENAIHYRSKKGAQDAHEAIRPTAVVRTPESVQPFLDPDAFKLYKLIWQRFVASQMNPALFDQTTIDIAAGKYLLRATGSVVKFNGFLAVYDESKDDDEKDEEKEELEHTLPPVTRGEKLALKELKPEQHFTEPPPRFNEATLVKALEEKGIGRPSTYATIINTIQEREYVVKNTGRFYPTELGNITNDLLVENFDDIFDIQYTAHMEEELDEIEDGKLAWTDALREFYTKFKKDLTLAKKHMRNVKRQETPTEEVCEKCGKMMVIKWGRHGSFLACSGYPECKNTRELSKEMAANNGSSDLSVHEGMPDVSEEVCENCGRPMVLKRGRFGTFLACSGYPECRTTKKIVTHQGAKKIVADVVLDEKCPQCGNALVIRHGRYGEFTACSNYPKCKYVKLKTIGMSCPECGVGELAERKSRFGKVFYGCSRYPDCKFTLWDKPLLEPCPQCGAKYILEHRTKKHVVHRCSVESCHWKEKVEEAPEAPEAVGA
ncbi:MAG: type I DNA topoisomerase [Acidobacteriia bacterium]|nr:type I DNA topoisomerase [Terriglobia bacterium]